LAASFGLGRPSSGQNVYKNWISTADVMFKKLDDFNIMTVQNSTGRFIMFSAITNIYNKKTKGPTLVELFTATGKLKKFYFYN
jgi:hypothetical protein